ncbi:hypothetical protein GCM10009837_24180 [Streptomyces durmitorensis]|uniref:DUF6126 family protein n=1 Tax=Streptomyces durmitorensis TaxID=319947 RepID=A0ABY4PNJ7_9ACTN|nr:DUF6126 family protein [Streptomyces durmitorensis]UQT54965.1 DUF6126 family protein [Streptomyces durmitorensis]
MTEPEAQQPDRTDSVPVPGPAPVPAKKAMSMEEKLPRGLWIRLIIYVAVGHLFAAFIYLLFSLGAQNQ